MVDLYKLKSMKCFLLENIVCYKLNYTKLDNKLQLYLIVIQLLSNNLLQFFSLKQVKVLWKSKSLNRGFLL